MSDDRLKLLLRALDSKGKPWSGCPSLAGSLRSIPLDLAVRKPKGLKHSIWELALHVAYWEYAVRRMLEQGPKGGFPRTPSNWPALPDNPTEEAWRADRRLVKQERDALIEAISTFDVNRLDAPSSVSSKHSTADVLFGIIQHAAYHTGQIALLKRLAPSIGAVAPRKGL